ncbi:MAG: FAD-binding protein, partial [Ignavibacteriae bacterium]|nr:FAD-binding protein [Ignavibacteriota bacterium]
MNSIIGDLVEDKIETFTSQLRGKIVMPSDASYDDERKVYNGMMNKLPGMIVKCVDVADVIASVNFGRENNLLISVRGGGHNAGGLGLCDDGLAIDLAGLKFVRVDVANKTVRVGGGNLWGEVDHATHPFGLAIPAGIISTTG